MALLFRPLASQSVSTPLWRFALATRQWHTAPGENAWFLLVGHVGQGGHVGQLSFVGHLDQCVDYDERRRRFAPSLPTLPCLPSVFGRHGTIWAGMARLARSGPWPDASLHCGGSGWRLRCQRANPEHLVACRNGWPFSLRKVPGSLTRAPHPQPFSRRRRELSVRRMPGRLGVGSDWSLKRPVQAWDAPGNEAVPRRLLRGLSHGLTRGG